MNYTKLINTTYKPREEEEAGREILGPEKCYDVVYNGEDLAPIFEC
jgi:hypothetical protein